MASNSPLRNARWSDHCAKEMEHHGFSDQAAKAAPRLATTPAAIPAARFMKSLRETIIGISNFKVL